MRPGGCWCSLLVVVRLTAKLLSYFRCLGLDENYSYYHLHREFVDAKLTDDATDTYSVSYATILLLSLLQHMYCIIICLFVSDHISIYFVYRKHHLEVIISVLFAVCVKTMSRKRTTKCFV